jgi:hypothetical protein
MLGMIQSHNTCYTNIGSSVLCGKVVPRTVQLHLLIVYIYRSLSDMQELTRHTISVWFEAVY